MPFGKFKGQPLSTVPDAYLLWLETLPNLTPRLHTAVAAELDKREGRARVVLPDPAVLHAARDIVDRGYRLVALQLHPDCGGTTAAMSLANRAIQWLRLAIGRAGGPPGGAA